MPRPRPLRRSTDSAPGHEALLRVAPTALSCIAAAWFGVEAASLLGAVGGATQPDAGGLFVAGLALLVGVVGTIAAEVLRVARRYRTPEHTLRLALQRIRAGDVGFRVSLRRGDPLVGLARECNELLDWLNANRPAGVRGGGDIVEVAELEEPVA